LLHNPRILFLDEPTIGLDVLGKATIRDFLKAVNREEQVTILLTTHDLDDIEQLCSRIIVIDHGHKVFDGELEQLLRQNVPQKRLVVEFESELPENSEGGLPVADISFNRIDGLHGEFVFDRAQHSSAEVIQLVMNRHAIRDVRIEEPGIEHVVKQLYASHAALNGGAQPA
jgi:ABC-2 type transport system ATP-binding protein